ncbi:MAG: hypothetical protein VXY73_07330 [Pseudomonadota bacterium]|nr:hypothetical protein [Pseudomonadota bacterium]MEC8794717.1 hypothetical protein [Pseudomonadota bacterium]
MAGWTQEDLDALDVAIASGARVVQKGDEKVEYRSLSEMERTRARVQAELSGGGLHPKVRQMTPRTSRGF